MKEIFVELFNILILCGANSFSCFVLMYGAVSLPRSQHFSRTSSSKNSSRNGDHFGNITSNVLFSVLCTVWINVCYSLV